MEAFQNSLAQLQQMFIQRMDSYQDELRAATPSATISALNMEFTAFRSFIMNALSGLQDQMCMLSNQVDSIEMRSRRRILLLHGVPESKNEDTPAVVSKSLADKLKIPDFSKANITRCHRMGRLSTSNRPRPILFKLQDMELRSKIWHAKTGLKGTGITLSEFLTKARHEVFTTARQRFGVEKCWTREGLVFVLAANGERHRINSLAELHKVNPHEASKTTTATQATSKSRRVANKK